MNLHVKKNTPAYYAKSFMELGSCIHAWSIFKQKMFKFMTKKLGYKSSKASDEEILETVILS
jgi:hypothetical protein